MLSITHNTTSLVSDNTTPWIRKEINTAALGISITAVSGVAVNMISTLYSDCGPQFLNNIVCFSFCSLSIAGTVLTIYSMIHLCKKIISEKNDLNKAVTATALGVLLTSVAESGHQYFAELAPSFFWMGGHSMAYCIGTNLAWQACAITGIGSVAFLGYAAYRTGQAILHTVHQNSAKPQGQVTA